MKRIGFFVAFALALASICPPAPATATPPSYDLTCHFFGMPNIQMTGGQITIPIYPVPGDGAPDTTDDSGTAGTSTSPVSCGWMSRPYRSGEKLNLCAPNPAVLEKSGAITPGNGLTQLFSVYNDGQSCMIVTDVKPAPSDRSSVTYPDATSIVCRGPLSPGSAPAASFYHEVHGTIATLPPAGTKNALAGMAPGSCGTMGSPQITTGSFCVSDRAAAQWTTELDKLEQPHYFVIGAHLSPGCHLYHWGSLQDLGPTAPLDFGITNPRPTRRMN